MCHGYITIEEETDNDGVCDECSMIDIDVEHYADWNNRDRKLEKRTRGMRVSNKSIFVMKESNEKRNKRKANERSRR